MGFYLSESNTICPVPWGMAYLPWLQYMSGSLVEATTKQLCNAAYGMCDSRQ